jgi:hypothetical protein
MFHVEHRRELFELSRQCIDLALLLLQGGRIGGIWLIQSPSPPLLQ